MNARVGFIGGGNMAEAMVCGFVESETIIPGMLYISDIDEKRLEYLSGRYGVKTMLNNVDVVANTDIIFLAIKPAVMLPVLKEIRDVLTGVQLVVSMVAGYSIGMIEDILGGDKRLVRIMPNLLVKVKKGAIAASFNSHVHGEERSMLLEMLGVLGEVFEIDEGLMDAFTALAGSGPAFVFSVIESLADGGVRCGLSRELSLKLSARVFEGASYMVLGGEHPEVLKDRVASPAGTTIEGMSVLEKYAVRSAFIEAVYSAFRRSKELSGLLSRK